MYNDPDPLIGVSDIKVSEKLTQNFTVQDNPVNKTYTELPHFVTIKGVAYFFFPINNCA